MESTKNQRSLPTVLNDEQLAAWIEEKHFSLNRLRELRESKSRAGGSADTD